MDKKIQYVYMTHESYREADTEEVRLFLEQVKVEIIPLIKEQQKKKKKKKKKRSLNRGK